MLANRLHKWIALDWGDRLLLLRALSLLIRVHFTLSRTQFRPDPTALTAVPTAAQLQQARNIAGIVAMAAAVCPVPIACLHRSVVLWRLLRARGIACRLKIGARSDAGPFGAHAWVECAGQALQEGPDLDHRFQAFSTALIPVRTP